MGSFLRVNYGVFSVYFKPMADNEEKIKARENGRIIVMNLIKGNQIVISASQFEHI